MVIPIDVYLHFRELLDAMEAMKKLDEERTNLDTASKELEQNLKVCLTQLITKFQCKVRTRNSGD